jgi:maltodextrin utilization protein YvdJ
MKFERIDESAALEEAKRASEGEATAAVVAMKSRYLAYADEADDDLICHLQKLPLWLVQRVTSAFRAKYRGTNVAPRYDNVTALIAELRGSY